MNKFIILLSLVAAVLLTLLSNWVFPWTTDSMFYISTAESIKQFKGLLFSNFFIDPASPDLLPTVFEPPGYPLLIAKLQFLGIDPYIASLVWPYLGFVLLPFLFFWIFKRLMPVPIALLASAAATFLLPMLKCSLMAWADIPYLCFSLITLIMVFKIVEKKGEAKLLFILLAGMVAGFSFLIRYVGATLLFSIGIGFIVTWMLRIFSLKDFVRTSLIYALGVLAVVFPYLWRNVIVFGKLQPAQMPPSELSFMHNVYAYLRAFSEMFFLGDYGVVIAAMLLALTIIFITFSSRMIHTNQRAYIFFSILFVYFWLNTFLLLGFKTVYFAPEAINERYLIQLAWIVIATIIVVFSEIVKLDPKRMNLAWGVLIFGFIVVQVVAGKQFYSHQTQIKGLASKIEQYSTLLKDVPPDYVIVSNVAEITYYYAKRNVRMLSNYTPYGLWKMLGNKRKYVVFLIKQDKFQSPAWEYPALWKNPEGYKKIFSDNNVDLLILK